MPLNRHALHDGPLLSVADVRCDACASGRSAEEHAHDDHLVLVRGGVFVKHIGRREIVADATRAVFFNRGVGYNVSHPIDGGDRCTSIRASRELWREMLAAHDPNAADREERILPTSDRALSARTVLAHQELVRTLRANPDDALRAEETILGVIDRVLADSTESRRESARPRRGSTRRAQLELVERTKFVLAANSGASHSLAMLAREVASSPFHLSRLFHREVGIPIHQYLLRLRLAHAVERLLDSKDSLSEIAHAEGFSSHSHFTTAFRQTFGVAPSSLRTKQTRTA